MEEEIHTLLKVSVSPDGKQYNIELAQGSTVPETAFCMMTVIKSLVKAEYCTTEEFVDLLNKYLSDPQYDEVEEDNGQNVDK